MATLPNPATIIGGPGSPYVRKVLAVCEMKGVPYRLDPIVPFFGDDRFSELNPLRRIPVFIDDEVSISDSTVICEYLEERYPTPALLPKTPAERAQARWIEEFADTRMGDVFIWRYFNQIAIRPSVWGEKGDKALVEKTLNEDIPAVLDYLEPQAPETGFRFGALSIADIAPACFLRTAAFVRFQIDAARWPRTAGWMGRTLTTPAFHKLAAIEDGVLRTPIAQQRDKLREMGAPISAETYGSASPRRGVMPI